MTCENVLRRYGVRYCGWGGISVWECFLSLFQRLCLVGAACSGVSVFRLLKRWFGIEHQW